MSRDSDSNSRSNAVESAAAEWLVKHDRGLTPVQQDEFLEWLASAPAHREAFNRHREMWHEFNLLAQWRPEHSAMPNPDLLARPRSRRRRELRLLMPALVAVAASVVVFVSWRQRLPDSKEPVAVAFEAARYQTQTLADGSIVELNGGAYVRVQYSSTERRIKLVQGEARFSVVRDPARPFIVHAAGIDVRAIGTAFNVKLADGKVDVLVMEGKVHVAQNTMPIDVTGTSRASNEHSIVAELVAGQRTSIPMAPAPAPMPVLATSNEEIQRLLDWRPKLLDFNSTPLAEVVAEFNRRNQRQFVICDDQLSTLAIVASIRSDNVEGFARLLEATFDIRVVRIREDKIELHAKQ